MSDSRRAPRPQPIRDAILAYLTEPRSAGDVARHINRPVPTATGHLAAMRRLGLVRRLGYSAYCAASYDGPACSLGRRLNTSERSITAKVKSVLATQRPLADIVVETGESEDGIRAALRELWLSGLVRGDEHAGYALVAAVNATSPTGARKARRRSQHPRLASARSTRAEV